MQIIKRKKYIILLILLFILLLIGSTNKVEAASASISPSSKTVQQGETVNLTASVTAGAWNLVFSGAGNSQPLLGQTSVIGNETKTDSISFVAQNVGTYKFTLTGDMKDFYAPNTDKAESVYKEATITVKAPEAPKTEQPQEQPTDDDKLTTGSTGGTATPVKSSNNYLKSLKLNTGSINFNKKTTKYTLDVAEDVESITITATADDERASVSGAGKINLVKGTNTAKVVVTAENGSARTYTLTIVRAGEEKNEEEVPEEEKTEEIMGLTSLSLKGIKDNGDVLDLEFSPEFATDTFYYECDVPYDINNIDVDSTCDILDAIIEITGNENLHDGENLINIIIKYMTEEGEEKTVTYQIEVNKLANAVQTISEEETPEPNKIFIVFLIIPVICLIVAIILIVRYKKQNKDPWEETEFGTYGKPLYDENEPENEVNVETEQEAVDNLEEPENIQENEIVNIAEEGNRKTRKKKKGKHF